MLSVKFLIMVVLALELGRKWAGANFRYIERQRFEHVPEWHQWKAVFASQVIGRERMRDFLLLTPTNSGTKWSSCNSVQF